jgi:hypothetical protein
MKKPYLLTLTLDITLLSTNLIPLLSSFFLSYFLFSDQLDTTLRLTSFVQSLLWSDIQDGALSREKYKTSPLNEALPKR